MKTFTKTAIGAIVALGFVTPVMANDTGFASGYGDVSSFSTSGGIAVTGGVAFNGNKGSSFVSNHSGAMNSSGIVGTTQFTEIDGSFHQNHVNNDIDGLTIDVNFETFSVSEQFSNSEVKDKGIGTSGFTVGGAFSTGSAFAEGEFESWGEANW